MDTVKPERLSLENLHDCFTYHTWDDQQTKLGDEVRIALEEAARVALLAVPDCADRSTGLRKLREARMDFNSAITHRGRF